MDPDLDWEFLLYLFSHQEKKITNRRKEGGEKEERETNQLDSTDEMRHWDHLVYKGCIRQREDSVHIGATVTIIVDPSKSVWQMPV